MPDYCRIKTKPLVFESGLMHYIGPIVLGLNDAMVEMTGALAGFTMALPNNRIIAIAGFVTGVAATLSMAAAEFLSTETERSRNPWLASLATGMTYLITVALLLLPYFLLSSRFGALALCLALAALIIFCFTWVVARIRHVCFRDSFIRMLGVSFSVAGLAFIISWLAQIWWGIEV